MEDEYFEIARKYVRDWSSVLTPSQRLLLAEEIARMLHDAVAKARAEWEKQGGVYLTAEEYKKLTESLTECRKELEV